MTRVGALVFLALLAVSLGMAQNNSPAETSNPSVPPGTESSQSNPHTVNVEGCLSSSAMGDNSYTLTEGRSGSVYRLEGDTASLVSHVGHEVVITGVRVAESSPGSPAAPDPAGSGSKQTFALQVNTVRMISEHCSKTGSRPPQNGTGASNAQNASNAAEGPSPRSDASLPQTATILPLLGFVGLGSLVTGFIFRER